MNAIDLNAHAIQPVYILTIRRRSENFTVLICIGNANYHHLIGNLTYNVCNIIIYTMYL